MLKFGSKNALLAYFWIGILKSYSRIGYQHHLKCLIAKFYRKTKKPKFGTKEALFGQFCARISNSILMFEINSLVFF